MGAHKLLFSELKLWTSGRGGWIARLHKGSVSRKCLLVIHLFSQLNVLIGRSTHLLEETLTGSFNSAILNILSNSQHQ